MKNFDSNRLPVHGCKIIQVIEVELGLGKGIVGSCYRSVKHYYSFSGELLGITDSMPEESRSTVDRREERK